jgi:hypothetical protein
VAVQAQHRCGERVRGALAHTDPAGRAAGAVLAAYGRSGGAGAGATAARDAGGWS